eukprot:TRINITY_DN3789_c0_g1_i1.p1 TRINITY_DN3789_c0_g1~~TRINITY_DN3789_c0_g1_i1.p1  ORF type:complete len:244 (-),score=42.39 TRINITY_DN3789_c0_g1_i1:1388-2119(-)
MKFIILLLVIALSLQLARATCPVNSQGTSAVTLTVSNNNTNWVVFTLAIPDENTADGSNKITDITFNYAACSLLEWTSGVPSVSATSALESDVLPQNWRAYKDANAGCGIIYMYREVPLADFLTCLTYQTKDNGKLIYQSSSAGTLARSYEISQTADGITTSTASVIQDLYEFQISLSRASFMTYFLTRFSTSLLRFSRQPRRKCRNQERHSFKRLWQQEEVQHLSPCHFQVSLRAPIWRQRS